MRRSRSFCLRWDDIPMKKTGSEKGNRAMYCSIGGETAGEEEPLRLAVVSLQWTSLFIMMCGVHLMAVRSGADTMCPPTYLSLSLP